jgi:hypothetical protein
VAGKYLIVYKGLLNLPRSLREFVKKKITDEYTKFDVDLDFTGSRPAHDLDVEFSNEIPGWPAFGESTRGTMNGKPLSGHSTVYWRSMELMRLQTGTATDSCEAAFPVTEASLGTMIANTAIHETGHMLGMDSGGYDDGGHSTDKSNYMWDPGSMPHGDTHVNHTFEYTVKPGDTMIGIIRKYGQGTLNKCRCGPTDLTYKIVWDYKENKAPGFVGDPNKYKLGRRANDPNWIYPGEKVALPNDSFRTQEYRHVIAGFLAPKSFTDAQIKTMTDFIASQVAAGRN